MKNIILFFCDICGTILGKDKISADDYKTLNDNLNIIASLYKSDNIIFSLISTDNKEHIIIQLNILKQFLNQKIVLGKQFFSEGYVDENNNTAVLDFKTKYEQIINYISEIEKEYHIEKVFYADDTEIYHMMLEDIPNDYNDKIIHIIPKNNIGLKELNCIISEKIDDIKALTYK